MAHSHVQSIECADSSEVQYDVNELADIQPYRPIVGTLCQLNKVPGMTALTGVCACAVPERGFLIQRLVEALRGVGCSYAWSGVHAPDLPYTQSSLAVSLSRRSTALKEHIA
jgi:hypothetical protein